MQRLTAAAAVFVLCSGGWAVASDKTVAGELVDHACFARDGSRGEDHAACARACAQTGQPVALVTDSGELYVLAGEFTADKNAALVPHMGTVVEVTGEVAEADGILTLTADSVRPLSEN